MTVSGATLISPSDLEDPALRRLAEFVAHLAECTGEAAVSAVVGAADHRGQPEDEDEKLALVAHALLSLRSPRPQLAQLRL